MPLPALITTADTFNTWFDATNNLISHVANTSVYVQLNTTATGNVNVTGTVQTGNLTVTGTTTLAALSITGTTTLGNVAVTNAASFANTLSVTGLTTFGANVGIGNTSPTHRLRVDGTVSLNGAVNALSTVGFSGAVNALSTLGVTGTLNALGALGVSGATTLIGAANALSTLGVSGTLNALSAFGVSGAATFAAAVNALSTLGVTGTLNALGALGVSGATTLNSTLNVTGIATFSTNVNIDSGTLFVDAGNNRVGIGNTTPGHALRVEGTTSINGALNALSTLAVTGAATFSNTLAVTGAATLSNTLAVTGAVTAPSLTTTGNITAQGGVAYLNAALSRYVQFDGVQYVMPGAQLLVNGQTVLNAGNYTSYAPSLTGTGASGSWNINAYPRRSDGAAISIQYSGNASQPSWLLGTNDGSTWQVWNPANFNVNFATTAGNITAYTINQSVGTGNVPTFLNLTLTNGNFTAINWDQAPVVGGRVASFGASAPVNGGPVAWLKITVSGVDVCFPVWGPI